MNRHLIRFCIAIIMVMTAMAAIQEPIKVAGGMIKGTPGWGWGIREYRGIPFAAPPVGKLRWQPPQPVIPWQGVRAADRFSPACIQREMSPSSGSWNAGLINTSEDCLYLNVWTPATASTQRLPVVLWIHGGGGITGSSAEPIYDGNALAKKGVVVVSTNYRLNVFGWFAHPELTRESEHSSSGNYGTMDQIAAIRWVKNNIAQFGGDPDKLTIFGQSGGCRSVNWLLASPQVKGTIRGAIAQSHAVFNRMTTLSEAEANGTAFMKAANKTSLADLRAMPAAELEEVFVKNPGGLNAAIVDGWVLPEEVYATYAKGKQVDVPLITGATNDEGGNLGGVGRVSAPAPGGRGGSPDTLAAYTAWVKQNFGPRADVLLRAYPAKNDAEAKKAYHDVYRDINFEGHRTWAKFQSTTGKSPVYLYMFSHIPPRPESNGNNPAAPAGAVHFSDMIYVFDNLRMKDYPWTEIDRKVADIMSSYWMNFVKTGNPNGAGLADWPVYNPKDEFWLNIANPVRLERFNSAGVDVITATNEDARKVP